MDLPITNYQGWALDPSYLTPAHMANFRPAYADRLKEKARKAKKRH